MRCSTIKSCFLLPLHWTTTILSRQIGCGLAFVCTVEHYRKVLSGAFAVAEACQQGSSIFFSHLLHRSSRARLCSLQKYLTEWLSAENSHTASWTHAGCPGGQSLIWKPLFCWVWIHPFQHPSELGEVLLLKKLGCSSCNELWPAAGLQSAQITLL